jgi:hypothetical protein
MEVIGRRERDPAGFPRGTDAAHPGGQVRFGLLICSLKIFESPRGFPPPLIP